MTSIFCLRLAAGLMAGLILLSPVQVNPRFYRAQFWIALGLVAAAALFASEFAELALWIAFGISGMAALAGSVVWALEGAPGGRLSIAVTAVALAATLALAECNRSDAGSLSHRLAGDAASAALLGTVMTAMLLGHFYLIAPGMSLTPLLRLLGATAAAIGLRMAVSALGLWSWTRDHSLATLNDGSVSWLLLRSALGFGGPLVLLWMAWRAARIRSTQSATGILYVAVVFCFLGELTGQLLWSHAGILL
ncbi:MAG TPA: hypothetical protein VKE94_02100 [Gemmataceae bacterium]|nr:hypothetical protein [Gemmataceae bacterium]